MYDQGKALEVTILDGPGTSSQNPLYVSGGTGGGGSSTATGTYESSPPTLTNGGTTPILVDSKGNQLVNLNAGFGSASGTPLYASITNTPSVTSKALYQSATPSLTNGQSTTILVDQAGNQLMSIHDPLLGYGATVAQFHVADNQSPGGTGYGILTGGVAQLRNPLGNLDRQTATAVDNVSAVGIATGAQQLASPITVTSSTSIAAGAVTPTITLSAVVGTNRGAPWNIQKGTYLVLDYGTAAKQETVLVTAVSGTNVTVYGGGANGAVAYAHSGTYVIQTFAYNQARDATTADGSTGAGFAAGATFLFNSSLNSFAGGWESERSANGELDGASGAGSAIAVGYEYNSGGPGGGNYDRDRNVQGKGRASATISTGGTQGSTSVTLSVTPTLIQPGSPLMFSTGAGTFEVAYVSTAYVAGTNPVTLSSGLVNPVTYTTLYYDVYTATGPGLAGMNPFGIGIEEDVVFDPVSGLYFSERSATQDEVSGQNIVMENLAVFNATTGFFDRVTGSSLRGLDVSLRKNAVVLTTTPLGASATYTGPWIDTTLDNTTTVDVQALANVAGGGNGFQIQQINDTSGGLGASGITIVYATGGTGLTRLSTQITSRYWRVVYTNGATAQTSFEIAYTTSGVSPVALDVNGNAKVSLYSPGGGALTSGGQNNDAFGVSGSGILETIGFGYAFNGTTFDRIRKSSYTNGPQWNTDAGSGTVALSQTAGAVTVKSGAGQLCRIVVSTAGTNTSPIPFFDSTNGTSGTPIGVLPASTPVGVYTFLMPAAVGISYTSPGASGPVGGISYF